MNALKCAQEFQKHEDTQTSALRVNLLSLYKQQTIFICQTKRKHMCITKLLHTKFVKELVSIYIVTTRYMSSWKFISKQYNQWSHICFPRKWFWLKITKNYGLALKA